MVFLQRNSAATLIRNRVDGSAGGMHTPPTDAESNHSRPYVMHIYHWLPCWKPHILEKPRLSSRLGSDSVATRLGGIHNLNAQFTSGSGFAEHSTAGAPESKDDLLHAKEQLCASEKSLPF